ncbi:MAG: hypothetical protein JSU77_01265 [Fidelibacterota bacterium]|nr:MAG: hypothetical protein JSU77_01265 [Candidatus Neomarinimicrobiota bacterium]
MTSNNNQEGLIIWNFDFAFTTFYEVETDAIEHLVPKPLTPIEVAPGISLFSLIALNFPKGALSTLPEFQELILSLIVIPDLSRGVPKSAMYILSLGSTNQEHLDHCTNYYRLPVFGKFSKVNIQYDPLIVEYEDDQGPIVSMKNIHPRPEYGEGERYFQAFVKDAADIYVADVLMKGSLFEHQQAGEVGKLWPHPFFRGIKVNEVEPVAFMQMLNKPGSPGQQFYPRPEKFT